MEEAAQGIEVAIENLEVAKAIYSKNSTKYCNELAEVYMLTADAHAESGLSSKGI